MTDVASKVLCEDLYRLSGWDDTEFWYSAFMTVAGELRYQNEVRHKDNRLRDDDLPAYDLGYLLRKLPNMLKENERGETVSTTDKAGSMPFGLTHCEDGSWFADYSGYAYGQANTPEDAAAKLCIELIKQGVLTP